VFKVSGELTKKLVAALPYEPICMNLLVYSSALEFKPTFSTHYRGIVVEISVDVLLSVR
jgi:hypothetical protein